MSSKNSEKNEILQNLVVISPQIIKLPFADFLLALIIVDVVNPVVQITKPEHCAANNITITVIYSLTEIETETEKDIISLTETKRETETFSKTETKYKRK